MHLYNSPKLCIQLYITSLRHDEIRRESIRSRYTKRDWGITSGKDLIVEYALILCGISTTVKCFVRHFMGWFWIPQLAGWLPKIWFLLWASLFAFDFSVSSTTGRKQLRLICYILKTTFWAIHSGYGEKCAHCLSDIGDNSFLHKQQEQPTGISRHQTQCEYKFFTKFVSSVEHSNFFAGFEAQNERSCETAQCGIVKK